MSIQEPAQKSGGRPRWTLRKRIVVAVLGVVVVTGVVLALLIAKFFLGPFSRPMAFDSAVWQSPEASAFDEGKLTPRQRMLDDVVDNVIPERCRSDLERLLGPSENEDYFKESRRDLIYNLGPERGPFGIDSEWLLIWLDAEGCYARHEIATD